MSQNEQNSGVEADLQKELEGTLSKAFGITLAPWQSALLGTGVNMAIATASNNAPWFGEQAAKLAVDRFSVTPERSGHIAQSAEKAWRYGIPFIPQIFPVSRFVASNMAMTNRLVKDFAPLLKQESSMPGFIALMQSDLEVVKKRRMQIGDKLNNDMKGLAVGGLSTGALLLSAKVDEQIDIISSDKPKNAKQQQVADKIDGAFNGFFSFLDNNPTLKGTIDVVLPTIQNKGRNKSTDWYRKPQNREALLEDAKQMLMGGVLAGGAFQGWLKQRLGMKSQDSFEKPTAGNMIIELRKALQKDPTGNDVSVRIGKERVSGLEKCVEAIFRQHQKDFGRPDITAQVEPSLKQAARQIAEAITDPNRELDPMAIAYLVDGKKGILRNRIKGSGPATGVITGDALEGEIGKLVYSKSLTMKTSASIKAAQDERGFSTEEAKQALLSLPTEERMNWAPLLTDADLAAAGYSKEDIIATRSKQHDLTPVVKEMLKVVAEMKPEDMRQLAMNDSQIALVQEMLHGLIRGKGEVIDRNRGDAMELTAALGTKLEAAQSGFLSELLARAQKETREAGLSDNRTFVERARDMSEPAPSGGRSRHA